MYSTTGHIDSLGGLPRFFTKGRQTAAIAKFWCAWVKIMSAMTGCTRHDHAPPRCCYCCSSGPPKPDRPPPIVGGPLWEDRRRWGRRLPEE